MHADLINQFNERWKGCIDVGAIVHDHIDAARNPATVPPWKSGGHDDSESVRIAVLVAPFDNHAIFGWRGLNAKRVQSIRHYLNAVGLLDT